MRAGFRNPFLAGRATNQIQAAVESDLQIQKKTCLFLVRDFVVLKMECQKSFLFSLVVWKVRLFCSTKRPLQQHRELRTEQSFFLFPKFELITLAFEIVFENPTSRTAPP